MGRDNLQEARPPAFYNKFTGDDSMDYYSSVSSDAAVADDGLPAYHLTGPEGGWDMHKSYLDQPTKGTSWDPFGKSGWDSPFRAAGVHYVRCVLLSVKDPSVSIEPRFCCSGGATSCSIGARALKWGSRLFGS